MGKFYEKFTKKLAEIRQGQNEPAPDFLADSTETLEYFKRQNALNYHRTELGRLVNRTLKKLGPEQRRRFYDSCFNENSNEEFTFERFNSSVDNKTDSTFVFQDNLFHIGADNAIRNLESVMDPKDADAFADEADRVLDPSSPDFPQERKSYKPYEARITELRDGIAPDDPSAAEKKALLDSVSENLVFITDDYLAHINNLDSQAVDGTISGMQSATASIEDVTVLRYFEKFEGGELLPKMPKTTTARLDFERIEPGEAGKRGELGEEELEKLKKAKPNFSQKFKEDVLSMTDAMEEIGEEKFRNDQSYRNGMYVGEQGKKLYGLWPLADAKTALAKAVEEGDFAKIADANREFMRVKGLTDKMMDVAHKGCGCYHVGNINSTRAEFDGYKHPIPVDYAENWIDHNRVNGVFCLYGLSKNAGKSVAEVLEDPAKIICDIGDSHIKKNGFEPENATVGAKLYTVFSRKYDTFIANWYAENGLFARGVGGAASVAENPEDREQAMGVCNAGLTYATYNINRERRLWQELREKDPKRSDAITAYSLLTDPKDFSLHALAEKMRSPNGMQELTVEAQVAKLRQEGKLDLGAIAKRGQRIIDEAVEESRRIQPNGQTLKSDFEPVDEMLRQSVAMKKVLACATEEEKQTQGYKQLTAAAARMNNRAWKAKFESDPDALNKAITALEANLNVQNGPKKGWFLSSANTDEHQKMVKSQTLLYYKLKALRGDPWPENMSEKDRKIVLGTSVEHTVNDARNKTYHYARIKSDNGRDRSFVHDVGRDRFRSSLTSLDNIDDLASAFGVISPAQHEINEARNHLFVHVNNRDWMRQNLEDYTAKLIYASTVDHKDLSVVDQRKAFSTGEMNNGIARIKNSPMFRKLMETYSADEIATAAMKGGGALTDKLISAQNAVEPHREGAKKPKNMTDEEKHEFMQNIEPKLQ